tara:strand:+ start:126 stop:350 length:225 start_codon:yes stop_codon:yes gene_type:complete
LRWNLLNKNLFAVTFTGEILNLSLSGEILLSKKVHDLEIKSFVIAKDYSYIVTSGLEGAKIIDPIDFKIMRNFK